jgi:serine protease Do
LAVLAVDAGGLVPIAFGNGETLNKGQIVVTLGNPYAIARDGQVSAGWGIVANLGRKAPPTPDQSDASGKRTLHQFGTLIQTDAKLNLGTSGGPLLNLQGQMVGLSVALAAVAGYEKAAGYAIPVDETFRRVVATLKQGREVEYGFLGIQPTNLRPQEILDGMQGIRVDRVVPGTPAARIGLEPDDIITAVGGRTIYEPDTLVLEVGKLPVEAVAELSVIRDGRKRTVEVTLAKYPVRGRKVITTPAPAWRGLRIDYTTALVDDELQGESAGAAFDQGVIVVEVEEGTPCWEAGLRRGMRITHVGHTPVNAPREFYAAVAGSAGPVEVQLAEDHKRLSVGPSGS